MFVKAIKIAENSIFPIVRIDKLPNNQTRIGIVGTGFFINVSGMFATTAHVFDGKQKDTEFVYWGNMPDKVVNPFKEITEVEINDKMDIFIGKIDMKSPGFFNLNDKDPEIGKSVCISGYPMAQIGMNQGGGPDFGGVRRYFQPTFVLDRVVAPVNTNGKVRTHEGFLTRDFGMFGMSGGPVFDIEGNVLGM